MTLHYFSGRTEYQSMEEMRRRARVERTFLRHSNRESQSTMNGNSSGARDYASSYSTTSPVIASRLFCRSQIYLRKWLSGRIRGVSPSSSTLTTTINNATRTGEAVTSFGTLDNSRQRTGCNSSDSTLSPISSVAAASSGTSKFQQSEISHNADTVQKENVDNNDKIGSKIDNSTVVAAEQRFRFIFFFMLL
ncbi:hypothetical protein WUBG_05435 [Wuchereria bancrofti]|uniref:Uncharacterized protein n=1 Tax=Wuchereria bancrofti TaxID=6293 RepID=J9F8H6_WUCBA|nr:hypothetical protein WUBG_05435 [Wuchereria bancrofti]VDM19532.1 unnamed protein product [Wuchereria bancrofti]